ncbi:vacuolar calcium ion transporter, putative [Talaromyces stipitatus ATCC 10500]|uniref:Vacuolar calcium ion transporter, putative n=1 Tax=Talaromyces stipitatus (strain ATCC 10500 / CBS 375.48 / QM 6759 / NRRL 1006) TaxID=441959 RepID=B8MUH0_TALSN|nr:vacuolar calcium ion transporter, putative [Talaromyces stipitatus ATCC 10500]EED11842.1 vacuolar calcium ion transporter, putative [Talaromyces stipitatus ATCC 10500]
MLNCAATYLIESRVKDMIDCLTCLPAAVPSRLYIRIPLRELKIGTKTYSLPIASPFNDIALVQDFLIGSIIFTLLAVVGSCFLLSDQQRFDEFKCHLATACLMLASDILIIPIRLRKWAGVNMWTFQVYVCTDIAKATGVVLLSIVYPIFQLIFPQRLEQFEDREMDTLPEDDIEKGLLHEDKDWKGVSTFSLYSAIASSLISASLIALSARSIVQSFDDLTLWETRISKSFFGFILMPICGNAAKVIGSFGGKVDHTISSAYGSSIQCVLLLLPFTILVDRMTGKDQIDSDFRDEYRLHLLFVAVLAFYSLVFDGKCGRFKGVLLMMFYAIIAWAVWSYQQI